MMSRLVARALARLEQSRLRLQERSQRRQQKRNSHSIGAVPRAPQISGSAKPQTARKAKRRVKPLKAKTLSKGDAIDQVLDGYVNATTDYDKAKTRLVALRGSEAALTEADHTILENIRDISNASFEKYFEV